MSDFYCLPITQTWWRAGSSPACSSSDCALTPSQSGLVHSQKQAGPKQLLQCSNPYTELPQGPLPTHCLQGCCSTKHLSTQLEAASCTRIILLLTSREASKEWLGQSFLHKQPFPHMQRLASLAWSSDQEWIQSSDSEVKLLCFYYCPRHPEDIGCLWNDSRQASYQQAKVLRWWKQLCTKAVIGEKEVQSCFSNRYQFFYFSSCNQDAQYSWGNKTVTSYFGYYFVNRCMASYLTMGTLVWVGSEREQQSTHRVI